MSDSMPRRLPGPDVVRAVAILGVVVMNYHGYLVILGGRREGGWAYDLFDPWEGPLSTRFAALFVVTAGVGVTLLTRSAGDDPTRRADRSWVLIRRGLLLYGAGIVFDFIWSGSILPYYGAMFVFAAVLWRLGTAALAAVGAVSAIAGWLIQWWQYDAQLDGHDTTWLSDPGPRSPRGLLLDVFVNGTHPLFPWLAFLCAGIIVGRVLNDRTRFMTIGIGGAGVWVIARLIAHRRGDELSGLLFSPHPFDRGLVYTASALGSALAVFVAITTVANRCATSAVVVWLQRAGQLSLTIYVLHAFAFNLVVNRLDWVTPAGLRTSLLLAVGFWIVALIAASAYQRRFGRGPAEWLYRRLTA